MQDPITEFHLSAEMEAILCAYIKYSCKTRCAADGHITLAELAFVIQQVKRYLKGQRTDDKSDLQQAHMDLRMGHKALMEQLKAVLGGGGVAEELSTNVVLRELEVADVGEVEVGDKKAVAELKMQEV
jgi:hypothetical protein